MLHILTSFISLYIVIQFIGVAFFLLLFPVLKNLYDHGYFLSKILGITAVTYCIFVLSSFINIPFTQSSLLILILLMSCASCVGAFKMRTQIISFLKAQKRHLIIGESIFLLVSLLFGFVRSTGTGFSTGFLYYEDSMDFSILNFLLRTSDLPPKDPWFYDSPLNYYYFGHLLFSVLGKTSNVSFETLYPLALGFCAGFIALILYTLFLILHKKVLPGLIVILLFFSVPINFLRFFFQKNSLQDTYIIFNSHYLYNVPYFTEYPLYSYSVASLHPSTINLMFFAVLLFLFFQLFQKITIPLLILIAGFLSVSFMTSSWDIFVLLPLLFAVFAYKTFTQKKHWRVVVINIFYGVFTLFLCVLFLLPYIVFYKGQGLVVIKTLETFSVPSLLFFQFGLFIVLLGVGMFSIKEYFDSALNRNFIPFMLILVLTLAVPFLFHLFNLNDTFFKFYCIAWLLFSLVVTSFVYNTLSQSGKLLKLITGVIVLFSVCSTLLFFYSYYKNYTAGVVSRYSYFYLRPEDKSTIHWINTKVENTPVIIEGYTQDFSESNRISSFTGLSTLIGWTYHTSLRGHSFDEIERRRKTVASIYDPTQESTIKRLLKDTNIEYIYFGELEKKLYGKTTQNYLHSLIGKNILTVAYSNNESILYKVVKE